MLKVLAPLLIASLVGGMAGAAAGAIISGWIRRDITTENTRTQFTINSYSAYLTEAALALSLSGKGPLASEDKARLDRATHVLMVPASDEIMCRALVFQKKVQSDNLGFLVPSSIIEFLALAGAIKRETMGEKAAWPYQFGECEWPSPEQ